MKICRTIKEIQTELNPLRSKNETLGLVPTMGALHRGHLSLVESCKKTCSITVVSIFVNPTQFNNSEDLENYPNTLDQDIAALEAHNVDFLFLPERSEMYPDKADVQIQLGSITSELEGEFRPGHFDGVGLVVSKFFNIIQPNHAFFGQKDVQQFYVIKKLRDSLNFPIDLVKVPTEREANGLAMSSRNLRLDEDQRNEARLIYKCLSGAKEGLLNGQSIESTKEQVVELFNSSERLALEYFEIVDIKNFKPVNEVKDDSQIALCIAAHIGQVRLIDNLMLFS